MVRSSSLALLVEDDSGMRQALARILSGAGFEVRAFESAEALLDVLGSAALGIESDCMVCDVRLPGLSGFDLHRTLGERGTLPPWIFITAHDEPSVADQARRAGAGFLLKPFEGRALIALVERFMGRSDQPSAGV